MHKLKYLLGMSMVNEEIIKSIKHRNKTLGLTQPHVIMCEHGH